VQGHSLPIKQQTQVVKPVKTDTGLDNSHKINFMYTFNNTQVNVSIGNYASGRKAIKLVDVEDGLPYTVVTTDMSDLAVKQQNEVLVKHCSQVKLFLEKHNIVTFTGKTVVSGWEELYICTLNPREEWVGEQKLFDYVV
jgi:hypothetical protein